MYADDTILFLAGRDTEEIEDQLTDELKQTVNWFNDNDLIVILTKAKRNPCYWVLNG